MIKKGPIQVDENDEEKGPQQITEPANVDYSLTDDPEKTGKEVQDAEVQEDLEKDKIEEVPLEEKKEAEVLSEDSFTEDNPTKDPDGWAGYMASWRLKDQDNFGRAITLNYDGKSKTVRSPIGGFLSCIAGAFSWFFTVRELMNMYTREISVFTYSPTDQKIENFNFADYDDSFNMIFGITAPQFNWFDNPYINATVYETKLTEDGQILIEPSNAVQVDLCKNQAKELKKFLDPIEDDIMKYANQLCLKNKGGLNETMHIAFETCNQQLYAKKCASQKEIDEFIKKYQLAVIGQKNIVKKSDKAPKQEDMKFPIQGSEVSYFPLRPQPLTLFNKKLENTVKEETKTMKIFIRADRITINDSIVQFDFTSRTKPFLNVVGTEFGNEPR